MTTTISTSSKRTLSEVIERVRAYAQDCTDDHTQSTELRFDTTGRMLFPSKSSKYTEKIATLPNEHAWNQLIEKLDAPAKAWIMDDKRCPVELRAKIFNNLAKEYRKNAELFIRMKGNNTRAVLSSSYTAYDNLDMITTVEKIVNQNGLNVEVYRPEIGDFMSMYVLLPGITFDHDSSGNTDRNGGLHPGVYISNGETGNSATRTAGGLFRSVCTNGAIIGWSRDQDNSLKMIHRHHDTYTFTRIIANGILAGLQISETAAAAYLASTEMPAGDNDQIKKLVNSWSEKYGLSITIKEDWLKAVAGEAIENGRTKNTANVVDVFNAATGTARSIDRPEEREEVERLAGDYLMSATKTARAIQHQAPAVQTISRPRYDFSQWRVSNG